MKQLISPLRLTFLVIISTMTAEAWINKLNLTLCGKNIRCYRKALTCESNLRFLQLEVFMLRALNECQTIIQTQTGIAPVRRATISGLEELLATAGEDQSRDLARCLFHQLGLWKDGEVDQVAFYYMLSYTKISEEDATQDAYLDALSSCPAPAIDDMPNFLGCVVQACVQSI